MKAYHRHVTTKKGAPVQAAPKNARKVFDRLNTVDVRNPNIPILALLNLVRLPNLSDFRRCLKSKPFGSVIKRSVLF